MQNDKPKMSNRDVYFLVAMALLLSYAAIMGYDKPKYYRSDLRTAEYKCITAESAHKRAYYNIQSEASRYSYDHPDYVALRAARFDRDYMRSKTGNLRGEAYMQRRSQVLDSLDARADSVRNRLARDYIEADSAYIATKKNLERAMAHRDSVRLEVQRGDSLAQLPGGKLFVGNVKKIMRDMFANGR